MKSRRQYARHSGREVMKLIQRTSRSVQEVILNGTSKEIVFLCSMATVISSPRGGVWISIEGKWDLIIAHPPCTYLTVTGNRWFDFKKYGKQAEQRWRERVIGAVMFMQFVAADCDRIAIENPKGIMGTAYRKADQVIQPYEFGHPDRKETHLWLKNLPKLKPTNIVEPNTIKYKCKSGKVVSFSADYGFGIGAENKKRRSKTYVGIGRAMAEQWG